MFITAPIWLATVILNNIAGVLTTFASVATPTWLTLGISQVMVGAHALDNWLPMYPHPEMSGIASVLGIVMIVQFILTLIIAFVFVELLIIFVRLVIQVLPWNTQQ